MKLFMSVFMVSVLFISAPSSAEEVSEPTVVLDRFRTALTEEMCFPMMCLSLKVVVLNDPWPSTVLITLSQILSLARRFLHSCLKGQYKKPMALL